MYGEAARSLFGPHVFNCMAPDDGKMNVLKKLGTPAQKEKWLKPIVPKPINPILSFTPCWIRDYLPSDKTPQN